MKRILFFLMFAVLCFVLPAQQVDLVKVRASKMDKEVENNVVKPIDYSAEKTYPVLYLLHGYGGNHNDWVNIVPQIKELATRYRMLVVCPNAANSWYFDSPVDAEIQYETYITRDLISYIDSHYGTIKDRNGRAIAGLSMGGHGAIYLAVRHKELFAMAGSMSGGVDITQTSQQFELEKVLGPLAQNEELWKNSSAIAQIDNLKNGELDLIVDCGTEDMFAGCNEEMHRKMVEKGIAHDYIVRPGNHNWDYWTNAVQYQMLYFSLAFDRLESTVVPGGKVYFYESPTTGIYDPSYTNAVAPSRLPEATGKLVVDSDIKYKGKNSLRLRYCSMEGGNWVAGIAAKGWADTDFSRVSEIRFWVYSANGIEKACLPLVYLQNSKYAISGKVKMGDYLTGDLNASTWTEVAIPLEDLLEATPTYDVATNKTIFFGQDVADGEEHTLNIDYITLMDDPDYEAPSEMQLFSDSSDNAFYDSSWVNVTAPSVVEELDAHKEKIIVDASVKYEGENALRLTYTSAVGGDWKAAIADPGWKTFDLTADDYSLHLFVNPMENLSGEELPLMYFEGNGGGTCGKLPMGNYVKVLEAGKWTEIIVPVSDFAAVDPAFAKWNIVKSLFLKQNAADGMEHTIRLDDIKFVKTGNNDAVTQVDAGQIAMKAYYRNGAVCYEGMAGLVRVFGIDGAEHACFYAEGTGSVRCPLSKGVYVVAATAGSCKMVVE